MAVAPLFLMTHFPSPVDKHCKSDTTKHKWSSQWQWQGFKQITPTVLFYDLWRWANAVDGRVASLGNKAKTAVLALHQPGEPWELPPGFTQQENEHSLGIFSPGYTGEPLNTCDHQAPGEKKLRWTNTPQNLIHSQPVKSTVINPNTLNVSSLEPHLHEREAKSPWETKCLPSSHKNIICFLMGLTPEPVDSVFYS